MYLLVSYYMPDIDLGIGALVVNETLVEERGVYVLIYLSDEWKPYYKVDS